MVCEMECQPTRPTESIEIVVNGESKRSTPGETLSGLLKDLSLDPSRVAIEMDRRIVKRAEWDTLQLAPGARIEIVQFVGGG